MWMVGMWVALKCNLQSSPVLKQIVSKKHSVSQHSRLGSWHQYDRVSSDLDIIKAVNSIK